MNFSQLYHTGESTIHTCFYAIFWKEGFVSSKFAKLFKFLYPVKCTHVPMYPPLFINWKGGPGINEKEHLIFQKKQQCSYLCTYNLSMSATSH